MKILEFYKEGRLLYVEVDQILITLADGLDREEFAWKKPYCTGVMDAKMIRILRDHGYHSPEGLIGAVFIEDGYRKKLNMAEYETLVAKHASYYRNGYNGKTLEILPEHEDLSDIDAASEFGAAAYRSMRAKAQSYVKEQYDLF